MSELISLDDALARLLSQAQPLHGSESVSTLEAAGRVLARDVISSIAVPPLDNSAMDGYAVRAGELARAGAGVSFPVTQRIPAGTLGVALQPGSCARIFTGAPLPAGADAVVMQEMAEHEGDAVRFSHCPQPGEWVRRAGEDIGCGQTVLSAGLRLRAQDIGLAASVGMAELRVFRRVRVACFFTGDELAMPGDPLPDGAIYNSNRFVLRALLQGLGCTLQDFGIVPDRLDATRDVLRRAAEDCDLVVTCGGVGVGEEDHVKPALQAEGTLDMWKIALKPGKPLAYGQVRRDAARGPAHFIGLPGNPVAAMVAFLLLVRPFILKLQGATRLAPQRLRVQADFDWPGPDRRREFLRVKLNDHGRLAAFPNQSSGVLTSTSWGDGLADIPAGSTVVAGQWLDFLPFDSLLN